jgi:hypothetical protein
MAITIQQVAREITDEWNRLLSECDTEEEQQAVVDAINIWAASMFYDGIKPPPDKS